MFSYFSVFRSRPVFVSMVPLIFLVTVAVIVSVSIVSFSAGAKPFALIDNNEQTVPVYLFWDIGCPHCRKANVFLNDAKKQMPWITVKSYELSSNRKGRLIFTQTNNYFGIMNPGVPLIVVGRKYFIGYDNDDTTGRAILTWAAECRSANCPNLLDYISNKSSGQKKNLPESIPEKIKFPILGELSISQLSLPTLTVVLAAVDGFNPCAMWVLMFLIGLLIGIEDKTRMWILGGVFLMTSALVYFAFLAAWLNIFLLLGALVWVRVGVGLFSFASGAYYLHEFASNPEGICKVTNIGQRQRIMEALKSTVIEKKFLLAMFGIIILAAAVNLIELLCSAGIPAVFTSILSMSDLSRIEYFGYLSLYIIVFLIDDLAIFVIAMMTLQITGMTASFSRYSHLVGGLIMVSIGGILLLKPEWLVFS